MSNTVRLNCLNYLQNVLSNVQQGNNGAALSFTEVVLGPINAQEANRKRAVVGIVPGPDLKDPQFPLTYASLALAVEFRVTWNQGDPPSQVLAEQVMGDIQKAVLADIQLGGNAVDLKEHSNEISLTLFSDKNILGVVHFMLLYRYNTSDPSLPA